MQILLLYGVNLLSFQGHSLPSLTYLALSSERSISLIGTNNYFPLLESLVFGGGSIDTAELLSYPSLTAIDIRDTRIYGGFDRLNTKWTYMQIANTTLSSMNEAVLNNLTFLGVTDSEGFSEFRNNTFPALTILNFQDNNNLSELCHGNFMPQLYQLTADRNRISNFSFCSLPSLHNMGISKNRMTTLRGNNLTSLTSLYASHNDLSDISGNSFPALVYLDLSYNLFTDAIVDVLIAYDWKEIRDIVLTENLIVNPQKALQRLQEKYPKARIEI